MLIKEKGTIKVLMDEQKGVGKTGNEWTAREFVIEVSDDGYTSAVHFKAFNRDADALRDAKIGDTVEGTYKPTAREYNGRWYDENRLLGVNNVTATSAPAKADPQPKAIDDDLPF